MSVLHSDDEGSIPSCVHQIFKAFEMKKNTWADHLVTIIIGVLAVFLVYGVFSLPFILPFFIVCSIIAVLALGGFFIGALIRTLYSGKDYFNDNKPFR